MLHIGPKPGFIEEVFLIEPLADKDGNALVLLKTPPAIAALQFVGPRKSCHISLQWKNTASREDGYVTGLEPGTGFPFNRRIERQL
jgi:hypothetical protein